MDLQNGDKTRPAIVNAVVALIRPVSQVSFSRSALLRTNQPIQVGLADLNRDNKLDLLVAEPYGSTISVLLGNGNGTFQGLSDCTFRDQRWRSRILWGLYVLTLMLR